MQDGLKLHKPHPIIEQLRVERISRRLTMFDFAYQLGYDQTTLRDIENGSRGGKFKLICDYADALGYELHLCKKGK